MPCGNDLVDRAAKNAAARVPLQEDACWTGSRSGRTCRPRSASRAALRAQRATSRVIKFTQREAAEIDELMQEEGIIQVQPRGASEIRVASAYDVPDWFLGVPSLGPASPTSEGGDLGEVVPI